MDMLQFKEKAIFEYCKDRVTQCTRTMKMKIELIGFKDAKPCKYKKKARKLRNVTAVVLILISMNAQAMEASYYSTESLKKEGTYAYSNGIMANGCRYRDDALTCASWDYSLGTLVTVTNLENKKKVTVRVTDRTARRFKGKRIDLSAAAFDKIARRKQGIVSISVEVVGQ